LTTSEAFCDAFECAEAPEFYAAEHEVVAVVLAYNEAMRLPFFLQHYRKLGISKFIIVDNNSDDGTEEIISHCEDVLWLRTGQPYKEFKSKWRHLICDRYLDGRWVVFPDVDELLVFPGWPQIGVGALAKYLDQEGYDCLFSTMVDMYPKGPLKDLNYRAGESFLDVCPYFDGSGYRHVPLKGAGGRDFKTPSRHVFGGARERLFHHIAKRDQNFFDKFLLATRFSLESQAPATKFGKYFDRRLFKLIKNGLPGVDPLMSKVPLVKWRKGYTFSGGVHNLTQELKMAPDWGALLHFKYLEDFKSKVDDALDRQQHAVSSRFYKDYVPHLDRVMSEGAFFEGSEMFENAQSVLKCGLMRKSKAFEAFLLSASCS